MTAFLRRWWRSLQADVRLLRQARRDAHAAAWGVPADQVASWRELAWQARFDEVLNADMDDIDDVLARHELDFARRPEEGP